MRSNSILLYIILLAALDCNSQATTHVDIEKIASATIHLKGYPDWIEIDGNSVWISNGGLNALQRIDPKTNKVVAEVKVNEPCAAFAIGFGSVWVMSCGNKSIIRIDPGTNKIVASIPMTIADAEGSIVAGENGVWILSDKKGILTRIDPGTNEVVANIKVKPNSFAAMAGFGSVWITNTGDEKSSGNGSVQRIDPKTNKVISNIVVGKQPRFLALGEKGIWTLNQFDGSVTKIDPTTDKVIATIACNVPGTGGDISAGSGFVWVRAKKELLLVIDPKINKVVTRFGPPAGSGAVRVGGGVVWVSAHDVNKVWRVEVSKVKGLLNVGSN